MKDNIIKFPVPDKETVKSEVEFAKEFSQSIFNIIFNSVHKMGVDLHEKKEDLLPISVLIMESVQAFYLKAHDIDHPLQDLAQELFDDV